MCEEKEIGAIQTKISSYTRRRWLRNTYGILMMAAWITQISFIFQWMVYRTLFSLVEKTNLYLQVNGYAIHNARIVKSWLDRNYPNRWIRRLIGWPPRLSPTKCLQISTNESYGNVYKNSGSLYCNYSARVTEHVEKCSLAIW